MAINNAGDHGFSDALWVPFEGPRVLLSDPEIFRGPGFLLEGLWVLLGGLGYFWGPRGGTSGGPKHIFS